MPVSLIEEHGNAYMNICRQLPPARLHTHSSSLPLPIGLVHKICRCSTEDGLSKSFLQHTTTALISDHSLGVSRSSLNHHRVPEAVSVAYCIEHDAMTFPVPRHELPTVVVTQEEYRSRKQQMEHMLATLVEDYEIYAVSNGHEVDKRRWKASTTRDRLKLYKERKVYGNSSVTASSSGIEQSCYVDRDNMSGARSRTGSAMSFSEEMADSMRMTLMVGECAGRMENAMYAVIANNHAELALVDIFLHEDVADCAILNRMEGPTDDDPYKFLGYKWFVRKSPTTGHLLKHRDSVYVEASGLTKTRSGEQLGYHIMHSVDLVDFPEMRERKCLRTSQSIRALYRQRPGNMVEVFIMGNLELSGMLMGPIATMFIQETLFNMPKLIDCGEAKRLTKMLFDLRDVREQRHKMKSAPSDTCGMCCQPKKRFMGSIVECEVCGEDVCSRCRTTRRVYQSQGILGRFNKVLCCKTCVLAAKDAKLFGADIRNVEASSTAPAPLKVLSIRTMVDQMEIRHRSPTNTVSSSSASFDGVLPKSPENYSVSSSARSSRDEELPVVPIHHEMPLRAATNAVLKAPERHNSNASDLSSASVYHTPMMSPVVKTNPAPLAEDTVEASLPLPPPPSFAAASRPVSQAEMYMKMLELQRKAQEAYDTTKQNQLYIDGHRV